MAVLVPLLLGVGCSSKNDLMPLEVGKSWSYHVRSGFAERIEVVKVIREIAVGSSMGYEIGGNLGISRLAWEKSELVASKLANVFMNPAIPLAVATPKDTSLVWKGKVIGPLGEKITTAELRQRDDKITISEKTVSVKRSTLTIKLDKPIVIDTWFQPTVGIVRQEQRVLQGNGEYELTLQMQIVD